MALKPLRKNRRITHLVLAKTLKVLLDGPASPQEIAELTGVRLATAQEWMRSLRKEGCVHISGWLPDKRGRDVTAVYKMGNGADKPRYRMTDAEKGAKYRAKKRAMKIQSMLTGVTHD
jgi:predicted ArsR family transcriptional regulator